MKRLYTVEENTKVNVYSWMHKRKVIEGIQSHQRYRFGVEDLQRFFILNTEEHGAQNKERESVVRRDKKEENNKSIISGKRNSSENKGRTLESNRFIPVYIEKLA